MSANAILKQLETAEAALGGLKLEVESLLVEQRQLERELALAQLDVGVAAPEYADAGLETMGAEVKTGVVEAVLAAAEAEWRRPVVEPPGEGWERIDDYIRGPEGLHWSWVDRYVRNTQFAWCGAFAAFVFQKAGLRADIRRDVMPSTYRLYKWAKHSPRMIPPKDLQVGDIVIVGPENGSRWGAHITICRALGAEAIGTFEGNGTGYGPDGKTYEGVVRRERPFERAGLKARTYRVLYGVRPLAQDFDP